MKRNNPTLVTVWSTVMIILFCSGQLQVANSADSSLILNPPVDQTVPVNSTAVFSCRVTGFLVWEIDAVQIGSDMARDNFCSDRGVCVNGTVDTSPDETKSVLLVAANENNGSVIRCVALQRTTSPGEESEVAILITFDHPAPPTDLLSLPVRPLHLNLSWSAPFIFPGTKTSYAISIRNVNTSEEIQREGLEETYYIFNGTEDSSACDVYQFSVAAVNSAGSSDQSEAISHSLPTLPNITGSIASMNHEVIILENGLASILISFEPAQSCQEYPVTNHSIMLQNSSADGVGTFGPFSPSENGRIQVELDNIVENARYSFSITAENSVGSITSNKTQFLTTDVQNASVSQSDSDEDSVIVTCRFAEGSQALGCHIELRIQSSIDMTMDISLPNQSLEATSGIITLAYPLACYDICAFDWESDGMRGELCVPVRASDSSDCGSGHGSESSGPNTLLIIGVAIGGTVGFLILVVAILLVSCYCMRASRVRAKSNDYDNGYHGGSGKYKNVEVIPHYHPAMTERSDSQATTVTILPPLPPVPDSLPPIYDAIQDNPDSGEKDYSSLTRTSPLSPAARADFNPNPHYSTLNQVPTYAVLESSSVPLGILPHQTYCEIDDLKRHESTAAAVSVSDPGMVPENERLYSEIPRAGTTV